MRGAVLVWLALWAAHASAFSLQAVSVSVNGAPFQVFKTVEACLGDSLTLQSAKKGQWLRILPMLREYENIGAVDGIAPRHYCAPIEYRTERLAVGTRLDLSSVVQASGTYYFACLAKGAYPPDFCGCLPLQDLYAGRVVQVVVRPADGYLGYLQELFGVPFVLPPRGYPGFGHQTDRRVGVDCAELPIYALRRAGADIPYVGPRGIGRYLEDVSEDRLRRGDLVHFGEQVSVLWEDRGAIGRLDDPDVLLQAYGSTVYFTTFAECGFADRDYRLFSPPWEFFRPSWEKR